MLTDKWPNLGKLTNHKFQTGDLIVWMSRRNRYTCNGKIVEPNPPGKEGFVKVIMYDEGIRFYVNKEKIVNVTSPDRSISHSDSSD